MSQSALVLGLGKSGLAVARHMIDLGSAVTVYAGKSSDAARVSACELEERGAKVLFDTEDVEGSYDLCVASPGIPQTGSFYQSALEASVELISEPEYAWRQSPGNWISVTGTNGKTTTTALLAHTLNESGFRAYACGNIGTTTIEAVEHRRDREVLVAELSSYQLASACELSPRIAVLLNITPDHISWHGSLGAYRAAKLKSFENMAAGQTAVITSSLDGYADIARDLRDRGIRVIIVGIRSESDCAYVDENGVLVCVGPQGETHKLVDVGSLHIKGAHNVENALVAASAALDFGCDVSDISAALGSFAALEHRIEPAGEVAGIRFFNDSKATNVDATLKALTAFVGDNLVLLLGGRDKGTDLSELAAACAEANAAAVCYGEACERVHAALSQAGVSCKKAKSMKEAFDCACTIASAGDVVLLSPACASFDEFESFEQRGDAFKSYVREYGERSS